MNQADLPTLKARLSECIESMGGRAPSDAAMKGWFIALKDFRIDDVVAAIDTWVRTKVKAPVPAEIRAICGGRLSDRLERQSAEDKRNAMTVEQLRPSNPNSVAYREFCRWFANFRATAKRRDPLAWARSIREKEVAGEKLHPCQTSLAHKALPDEPESDAAREARLEREAIQAEGAA